MNYQEFQTAIISYMQDRLDSECEIRICPVMRNNNVTLDGLYVTRPGCNLSASIYLNPFYHRYLNGLPLEEIQENIYQIYSNKSPMEDFPIADFKDYTKVRNQITMRLISFEKNQAMLEKIPHKKYLDMAIIYSCRVTLKGAGDGDIKITNDLMRLWGIDTEELDRDARRNAPTLNPYKVYPIIDYLKEHVPTWLNSTLDEELCFEPMYILTNQEQCYGASVLLYEDLLRQISEDFESDLLIIPSSVHELIFLPYCSLLSIEEMTELIQSVNETVLAEEEVLSDHAYLYRYEGQCLECA